MGECRFEARLLVGVGGRIVEGKTRARWAGNPSGAKPTARPGQARPGQGAERSERNQNPGAAGLFLFEFGVGSTWQVAQRQGVWRPVTGSRNFSPAKPLRPSIVPPASTTVRLPGSLPSSAGSLPDGTHAPARMLPVYLVLYTLYPKHKLADGHFRASGPFIRLMHVATFISPLCSKYSHSLSLDGEGCQRSHGPK